MEAKAAVAWRAGGNEVAVTGETGSREYIQQEWLVVKMKNMPARQRSTYVCISSQLFTRLSSIANFFKKKIGGRSLQIFFLKKFVNVLEIKQGT